MKVFLDSLGCRLNQSEIEQMARHFRIAGHQLVDSPAKADLVVINTCTVTADAAASSRARSRRAHRANPESEIVLTGCWSALEPGEAGQLPGVSRVISNADKDRLVSLITDTPEEVFERQPVVRRPIPGLRMRTRAFVKAQDGCDFHCTYCLTTVARGPARSLAPEQVLSQIRASIEGGAQEVVLSGVQLSGYGRDLDEAITLNDLVRKILSGTEVPRLRLSSLEPWGLPDDFFELWTNPRLCRQLHLPLQSGSPSTLRRMGRPTTPERFARLVGRARKSIPGVAVTTDIIVGFPGESQTEFDQSLAFVRDMAFADAHVFAFSPRPGTAAARLPHPVPPPVTKRRAERMRSLTETSATAFRRQFLGQELEVLWETATALDRQGWRLSGLTDNYMRVVAHAGGDLWNRLCRVKITDSSQGELLGELS